MTQPKPSKTGLPSSNKKVKPKTIIVIASCVVLVVALAIALPLILNNGRTSTTSNDDLASMLMAEGERLEEVGNYQAAIILYQRAADDMKPYSAISD